MSEKNHGDDESSFKEKSKAKENKTLNLLRKYGSIIWAELRWILADVKNASKKLNEEKAAIKKNVNVEELPNQAKPSTSEFFKNQISNFKMFWSYLNRKSKIFIIIGVIIVGFALTNSEDGDVALAREAAYCTGYLGGAAEVLKEILPRTVGSARSDLMQLIPHLERESSIIHAEAAALMMASGMTDHNEIIDSLNIHIKQGAKLAFKYGDNNPLDFIMPKEEAHILSMKCLKLLPQR